jgi:hypothetical protein
MPLLFDISRQGRMTRGRPNGIVTDDYGSPLNPSTSLFALAILLVDMEQDEPDEEFVFVFVKKRPSCWESRTPVNDELVTCWLKSFVDSYIRWGQPDF